MTDDSEIVQVAMHEFVRRDVDGFLRSRNLTMAPLPAEDPNGLPTWVVALHPDVVLSSNPATPPVNDPERVPLVHAACVCEWERELDGWVLIRRVRHCVIHRPATEAPHAYLSTACLHDRHPDCKRQCKYCMAPCGCPCHQPPGRPWPWSPPAPDS